MVSTIEFIKNMKERLPLNLQKESDVVADEFISSVAYFINRNNGTDFNFVCKYALTGATCKMSLQGRFEIKEFLAANGIDVSEPFAAENLFVICSAILQIDSLPEKIIDEDSNYYDLYERNRSVLPRDAKNKIDKSITSFADNPDNAKIDNDLFSIVEAYAAFFDKNEYLHTVFLSIQ